MLLFHEIQHGNQAAFNELFLLYYDKLLAFAKQYTRQTESAEEITSELFVKIWIRREGLSTVVNPEVYLFISIKNACLNLIRAGKKHGLHVADPDERMLEEVAQEPLTDHGELVRILDHAVARLPDQRRIIFKLIKEDGLKSKAVAGILGISVRTVENQLYKAVKTLADALSDYLGYHPQSRISKKQALSELPVLFFF